MLEDIRDEITKAVITHDDEKKKEVIEKGIKALTETNPIVISDGYSLRKAPNGGYLLFNRSSGMLTIGLYPEPDGSFRWLTYRGKGYMPDRFKAPTYKNLNEGLGALADMYIQELAQETPNETVA